MQAYGAILVISMNHELCRQAKAMVALAFRNGPIEDVHAGKVCPTCADDPSYSGITQEEMEAIMKNAVNWMYTLLRLRDENPAAFARAVTHGLRYATTWDEPYLAQEVLRFVDADGDRT